MSGIVPGKIRSALRVAGENALVSLLAYLGGLYLTVPLGGTSSLIGALWAAISGLVVLQATRQDTLASAWLRILGTLIGAVVSAIYLSLLPFSALGMAASIGATVLLCQGLRVPDHARLASITVAIIMVISAKEPGLDPKLNAALRFIESCIGAGIAVAVVAALSPARSSRSAPS
jgi:uncharacterized membrane protein YccC